MLFIITPIVSPLLCAPFRIHCSGAVRIAAVVQ